jgi:hypothetical protein
VEDLRSDLAPVHKQAHPGGVGAHGARRILSTFVDDGHVPLASRVRPAPGAAHDDGVGGEAVGEAERFRARPGGRRGRGRRWWPPCSAGSRWS